MIFKTVADIPNTNVHSGDTGYGGIVGVGPDEFRYMIKFVGEERSKTQIVYLNIDSDLIEVVDSGANGLNILEDATL